MIAISSEKDKLFKIINFSIMFFMVYPFIFLSYIYMVSSGEVVLYITQNTEVTIGFVSTMIMPFIGCILRGFKENLEQKKEIGCFIKLFVLLISQVILFNIPACVLLSIIIFKVVSVWDGEKLEIKKAFIYFKNNFTQFLGVLLIFILSSGIAILGSKII